MLFALSSVALAQVADPDGLNVQAYRPPVDADATLWTETSRTQADGTFTARVLGHYTRQPLVFDYDAGGSDIMVSDVLQTDVIGAYHYGGFRGALLVPLYLAAEGSIIDDTTGLGDIGLDAKYTLLEDGADPLGVALDGRLFLPTGTIVGLASADTGWELAGIVDRRIDSWGLAANLGIRGGPSVVLDNIDTGDQFFYRGALAYHVTDEAGASFDLAGHTGLADEVGNEANNTLEGLLGGFGRVGENMVLRGGFGRGLTGGIGSPDFRAIVGLSWEPRPITDLDGDGIVDDNDGCPSDPEDRDGYMDSDGCPDPSTDVRITFTDPDGSPLRSVQIALRGTGVDESGNGELLTSVHGGTYQLTAKSSTHGSIDQEVQIPGGTVHHVVKVLEPSAVSVRVEVVNAHDRPIDAEWSVGDDTWRQVVAGSGEGMLSPGEYTFVVRSEGYAPAEIDAMVQGDGDNKVLVQLGDREVAVGEKIELKEKVFFITNKASIQQVSHSVLNEVADILKKNPQITKIRIEGHTDAMGSDSYNLALSKRRAKSVLDYLASRGIDRSRMGSVGLGETKPIATNDTEDGREKNRRVEIYVEAYAEE